MRQMTVLLMFFYYVVFCEALESAVEGRDKKKIGLYIYLVDLVIKKIFILKLIYAFAFWLLLHKAGYIFGWFVSYLKDHNTEYHGHHEHPHVEYGPPGPYRRKSQKPVNPYSTPYRKINPY